MVGAFGDRREHQPGWRGGGQVLRRVFREVGPAVEHRLLHLLDEHAGPAHLVDRHVGATVAAGLDDDELDVTAEQRRHPLGLA